MGHRAGHLIAEQRHRIVAAAHLLRYGADEPVGSFYRDTAEIRWLVCYLPAPFWPDAGEAGTQLIQACLAVPGTWQVRQSFADGTLPGPGVYGVPAPWPHIRELYRQAGFTGGRNETVLAAAVVDLHHTRPVPQPGLHCRRTLGINGTRFSAVTGDTTLGYIEVDTNLGEAGRFTRGAGWADIGNLEVFEPYRRRGIGRWLLAAEPGCRLARPRGDRAADGLRERRRHPAEAAFWSAVGFSELTRTVRGLTRPG